MKNKIRITLASFLAYFVMSGMLSPIGILIGPMAEYFQVEVTEIGSGFSWLTMGILVGSILSLFLLQWFNIRLLMMSLFSLITFSLAVLTVAPGLMIVGIALGLVGICCGVGLAGAASIISNSYEKDQRASMLVITDGSFSVAGILTSMAAVALVQANAHWSATYLGVGLVALFIVLLIGLSTLPGNASEQPDASSTPAPSNTDLLAHTEGRTVWPASVWLCISALFLYTLGQYSLLWWLPNYAETTLFVDSDQAGDLVGKFWTGMFLAQIFVAWWVLKIGANRLVLLGVITTTLCSLPIWMLQDMRLLPWLSLLWGFANLGLLKIVIAFATNMVSKPTPRLISALLLGATMGTAVSPWVTSQIVAQTSSHFVLQFGSICYLVMSAFIVIAYLWRPKKL